MKEDTLKCIDIIFKRFNLFITIIIAILVLFKDKIETLIDKLVVFPYLSKIYSGDIPIWTMIVLFLLISLYFTRIFLRKYVYSCKFILCCTIISLIYSYYRIKGDRWNFRSFTEGGSIKYLDIIIVIMFVIISAKLYSRHTKKSNTISKLTNNAPLDSKSTKKIFPSRKPIVDSIAESLINIRTETSFAIAIISPWGNGKTTFLNFLVKEIKKNDESTIIINFSPWFCKTEADIISLFLNTLADSLKNYHSNLDTQIQNYGKTLLSLQKNQITEYIEKGINFLSEPKDIKGHYNSINECIKDLKRNIYITIDDIDRLYNKEIIECLKIIRNTANFANVIFIVPFDRGHVIPELNKEFNENAEKYIDKIFQLQFELPEIEKEDLIAHIETSLKEITSMENVEDFIQQSFYENTIKENTIDSIHEDANQFERIDIINYVNNIRDCNKIINLFITHKKIIDNEVEYQELLLICILKTKYPKEALEIYTNLDSYFTFGEKVKFKDLNEPESYIMNNMGSNNISQHFKINDLNKDKEFIELISAIFFRENSSHKSVAYDHNYKIYYNGALPKVYIKEKDFKKYITTANDLISQIDDFKENNYSKLRNLALKLSRFSPTSKEQAEIVIYGLIYLENKLEGRTFIQVIHNILKKYKNDSVSILSNIINDLNKIDLQIISNIIFNIKMAYVRKTRNTDYELIIDIDNGKQLFHNLSLELLKYKINQNSFDNKLFNIYYNCRNNIKNINNTDTFIIDENANKILRDFVTKPENAPEFIKILIIDAYNMESDKQTPCFIAFLDQLFSDKVGDFKPFEDFLNKTISENPEDEEIKKIYEQWKTVDTTQRTLFIDSKQQS